MKDQTQSMPDRKQPHRSGPQPRSGMETSHPAGRPQMSPNKCKGGYRQFCWHPEFKVHVESMPSSCRSKAQRSYPGMRQYTPCKCLAAHGIIKHRSSAPIV